MMAIDDQLQPEHKAPSQAAYRREELDDAYSTVRWMRRC